MNNKIFLILTLLLAVAFADTLSTINPGSATTVPYVFAAAGANANTYFSIPTGATVSSASLSLLGSTAGWGNWDNGTSVLYIPAGVHTGANASAVYDANGILHVVFSNLTAPGIPNLAHAYFDGTTWRTEIIYDPAGNTGESPSITADAAGVLHVAFFNNTNNLGYAYGTTGAWTTQVVYDPAAVNGNISSIVIDAAGVVHILFNNNTAVGTAQNLGHAYGAGSGAAWTTEVVYTAPSAVGGEPSAVVGSAGNIYVSFANNTGTGAENLGVAYGTTGAWTIVRVYDPAALIGNYSSIVEGTGGVFHIFFENNTGAAGEMNLGHAYGATNAWTTEVVYDPVGTAVGAHPSAIFSYDGNIHAVFMNRTNFGTTSLAYVNGTTGNWLTPIGIYHDFGGAASGYSPFLVQNTSGDLTVLFENNTGGAPENLAEMSLAANYPRPSITVGSTAIYARVTNLVSGATPADFTTALTSYLATCTGNPCNVPIGVATTTAGIITLSNTSIVYTLAGPPQIAQTGTGTGTGKKDTGKETGKTGAETGKTEEEGQESGAGTGTSGTGATATTTTLWIIIGVIAVLIIGGAVFFLTQKK